MQVRQAQVLAHLRARVNAQDIRQQQLLVRESSLCNFDLVVDLLDLLLDPVEEVKVILVAVQLRVDALVELEPRALKPRLALLHHAFSRLRRGVGGGCLVAAMSRRRPPRRQPPPAPGMAGGGKRHAAEGAE